MLDKLLTKFKTKTQENKGLLEEQIRQKLKAIVYDDSLVEELTPVFVQLHAHEGFSTVLELLETKEKQIEAIAGGEWFKQESKEEGNQSIDNQPNGSEEGEDNLVDAYLTKKYGENK